MQKKKVNFDYVFQLTYKTPFIQSNDLDSFVYLMEFFLKLMKFWV